MSERKPNGWTINVTRHIFKMNLQTVFEISYTTLESGINIPLE